MKKIENIETGQTYQVSDMELETIMQNVEIAPLYMVKPETEDKPVEKPKKV